MRIETRLGNWRWWLGGALVVAGLTPAGQQVIDQGTEIMKSLTAKWSKPPAALAPHFAAAEARYKLPTGLLTRVGYQECRWRADIISGQTRSSAGAVGVMQIIPKWHPGVEPLNPAQAIPYAGKYLADLAKQFGGDFQKACAAYNWGPGNLAAHLARAAKAGRNWKTGLPTETANYVQEIYQDLIKAGLAST